MRAHPSSHEPWSWQKFTWWLTQIGQKGYRTLPSRKLCISSSRSFKTSNLFSATASPLRVMELLVLPAQPQSVLVVGSSQHRALLVSMDSASSDPISTHKVLLLSTDSDILFNYQFLLLGRWEWPGLLGCYGSSICQLFGWIIHISRPAKAIVKQSFLSSSSLNHLASHHSPVHIIYIIIWPSLVVKN